MYDKKLTVFYQRTRSQQTDLVNMFTSQFTPSTNNKFYLYLKLKQVKSKNLLLIHYLGPWVICNVSYLGVKKREKRSRYLMT